MYYKAESYPTCTMHYRLTVLLTMYYRLEHGRYLHMHEGNGQWKWNFRGVKCMIQEMTDKKWMANFACNMYESRKQSVEVELCFL